VKSYSHYAQAEAPLISQACLGNSEAFSELARRHSRQIYSVSLRILKNHADAEDNLQDVLCRVYQNIRRFQGRSCFSTWIIRITINEALMKIRRESPKRSAVQADLYVEEGESNFVLEVGDGRADPERQYIAGDLVEKAFRGLHPSVTQMFVLNKGEGWTHRELAGTMGISAATVKSRIFRARARMQQHLRARC